MNEQRISELIGNVQNIQLMNKLGKEQTAKDLLECLRVALLEEYKLERIRKGK